MDSWMVLRMDIWMHEWTDGWMDRECTISIANFVSVPQSDGDGQAQTH